MTHLCPTAAALTHKTHRHRNLANNPAHSHKPHLLVATEVLHQSFLHRADMEVNKVVMLPPPSHSHHPLAAVMAAAKRPALFHKPQLVEAVMAAPKHLAHSHKPQLVEDMADKVVLHPASSLNHQEALVGHSEVVQEALLKHQAFSQAPQAALEAKVEVVSFPHISLGVTVQSTITVLSTCDCPFEPRSNSTVISALQSLQHPNVHCPETLAPVKGLI